MRGTGTLFLGGVFECDAATGPRVNTKRSSSKRISASKRIFASKRISASKRIFASKRNPASKRISALTNRTKRILTKRILKKRISASSQQKKQNCISDCSNCFLRKPTDEWPDWLIKDIRFCRYLFLIINEPAKPE